MTDLFEAGDQDQTSERDAILAKWKDKPIDELLKAKVESDLYIKSLERQKDELRTDFLDAKKQIEAQASMQELVDKLNAKQTPSSSELPNANEIREPKFDPKDMEQMILNKIQETELNKKRNSNLDKVQAKLKERYGSNSATVLKEQANTLGLSDKDVHDLAEKSPEAFFRLMGLDQQRQESFQTPPRSNQRNDNFAPKGETKRTWSYYQELKKTNPKLYLDPKIAVQMHNDAIELGEAAFYGQNS